MKQDVLIHLHYFLYANIVLSKYFASVFDGYIQISDMLHVGTSHPKLDVIQAPCFS